MNKELIATGLIGLIIAWAVWNTALIPALFAGIVGLICVIAGFTTTKHTRH